ncbi:MAG: Translation elongation factor G [uncultured Chloroflexi bacterium]|uniref:Elongation factor G n=1 Tax=uncultured Chloroflexota bacterium TaxID=166587 RepID=A0A6J4JCM2_9CHLR|nr:MAG: Translation elongation factor G [uncultured Chloroflexota bacterium]
MGIGKTTLAEAMLFNAGAINRMGRVDDGTTVSDYDPDEHRRTMSVNVSVLPVEWKDHKINIVDTPGYADFVGEVAEAVRVVDGAVILACAVNGLEVGSEQVWEHCKQRDLPRIVVVNRMDRENASFERTLQQLRETFGKCVVPVQVPIGSRDQYRGVVDLLDRKALMFGDGGKIDEGDIPADLQEEVQSFADQLMESVAETDDELIMKYLEGEPLTHEEVVHGVHEGVRTGSIVPVFSAAALTNRGIGLLLDAITTYLPSPVEAGTVTATNAQAKQDEALAPDPNGPLAAMVFKTLADPFIGKLTYFRVYSGTLRPDSHLWNATKEKEERIGTIYTMLGKNQETATAVPAGDFAAVAKLAVTATGDTLCAKDHPLLLSPIAFPAPVYSAAVEAKSRQDQDRMGPALQRMQEEDPTIQVRRDAETGQTVISGMGDSHIEITVERIKRKFGAEMVIQPLRVPYRETLRTKATAEGRFVRQTGGHGQYGVCVIEVEPLTRGEGYHFADKIVGGVVSHSFRPAVDKGIQEAMADGVIAGYPLVDVRATLVDGKEHAVDSSEMAFKIAGSMAFKSAAEKAGVVLLEPVVKVEVTIPEQYTGDIMGDLSQKRGRVHGMNPNGNGTTTIEAEVPQAEMVRYAADLRSMTQGRGQFKMQFDHYDEVPGNVAQKVVEQAKSKSGVG